jgi:hypothetical protein
LFKVGFLSSEDMVAVGLKVFSAYFDLGMYRASVVLFADNVAYLKFKV